jgi:hypothetical protein
VQGLGLVFVAVYQKALKLLYVDELLDRMNRAFSPRFRPDRFSYPEFDAAFQVGAATFQPWASWVGSAVREYSGNATRGGLVAVFV